jgi:hypothetical protein
MRYDKKQILDYFNFSEKKIFKHSELRVILELYRFEWNINDSIKVNKFINGLINGPGLNEFIFEFPLRKEKRYTWGKVPFLEVVLSLNDNGYFSHYTAMALNGLIEEFPKTYYLNVEQPAKDIVNSDLEQKNINLAFRNKCRKSYNFAVWEDKQVYILNGKSTNSLGVKETEFENAKGIKVTDIERTLIDITVRPIYSGGTSEVLKAIKLRKKKFP